MNKDIEHINPEQYSNKYVVTFSILADGDVNEDGWINHEHINAEIVLYGNSGSQIEEFVKKKLSIEIQEFTKDDKPTHAKIVRSEFKTNIARG